MTQRTRKNRISFQGTHGGGGGLEVAWAPGQSVPHQRNAAISVSGEYADIIGGRISQNVSQYSPDSGGLIPVGGPSYAFVFGAGGGVGVQEQLSVPLPYLTWGRPPAIDSQQQMGRPQSINNLPKTYMSQGSTQSSYGGSQSSNSGGSSFGQLLSSLSNLLSQLSALISSIGRKYSQSNNDHIKNTWLRYLRSCHSYHVYKEYE